MINRISIHENRMQQYAEHFDSLQESTILNYAEFITSPDSNGIQALLARIHLLIMSSKDLRSVGNKGVFQLMLDQLEVIEIFYYFIFVMICLSTYSMNKCAKAI